MTVRTDLIKEVRSSVQRILEYFTNVEDLPHFHPEYIKNVRIIHRQGSNNNNNIEFEKKLHFTVRRLNP